MGGRVLAMSPVIAAVYILTIISGSLRVEVISKPGLTAAACRQAGEEWTRLAIDHRYECRAVKFQPAKSKKQ